MQHDDHPTGIPLPADDSPVEPPAPRVPCYDPECDRAAGYPGRPYSAWCQEHSPRDDRPVHGGASQCAACGNQFGRLTDFDRAQEKYPRGHPDFGCFTGVCRDPATLDGEPLARDRNGTWQTASGLVKRQRSGERLHARGQPRETP